MDSRHSHATYMSSNAAECGMWLDGAPCRLTSLGRVAYSFGKSVLSAITRISTT